MHDRRDHNAEVRTETEFDSAAAAERSDRVAREVRYLVDGAVGGDANMALACQRLLIDEYFPWLQRRAVARARANGLDWAQIGRVTGTSRQAARQRFGGVTSVDRLLPPRLPVDPHSLEAYTAERVQILAGLRRIQEADDAAAAGSLVPW